MKQKNFEMKWKNLDIECMEKAKFIKKELDLKHGNKKFYNLDEREKKRVCAVY